MSDTETFSHPKMYAISAVASKLLFTDTFADGRWLDDGQTISRHGQRYQVVAQEKGVHEYFVWLKPVQ